MAPSSFLAALVVLGPKVVGGAFTVTANRGAPSFVGLELLAAPFAFSRRDFVVDAPVQLTRDAEWSTRACPPSYLGNASLAGVIVIHADAQWTACSFEQYAVAAGRLGAVLWAQWDADLAMRGMRPGMMKHHWQQGDARALASPVALDLTQDAGVPFIHALASGRIEAVRARVTADQSEWEELFASARFAAWRAVLIIGSAAVLELAACRLYAFARADRGLKCTLGNVVLGTELLLNSERVLYLALDPLSSNGRVEIRLGVYLHSMHVPLSTVTTALFFIFFVEAARSEGLAPHGLAKTSYKRALVAFVAAVLCLDVCTTALVTHTVNRGIVLAHRFVSPVVMPIFNTIVALNIAQRARAGRSLASLAPVTLGRLLNVVRTTAMCSASTAVCSLLLGCGLSFRPLPAFWVTLVQWLALDAISYGQCDAFFPPGVRVPRGPLRRVLTKTLRMHCRLARVALVRAERVRAKLAPARLNPAHSGRAIIPAESRLTRFESDPSKQHLLLGVSPHFLRDFMNARGISSVESTYDVAEVVRALTLRSGKSIAETNAGTRDSEGNLAVGRANLFVSHAQSCCFFKLVEAIELHIALHKLDPARVCLWIDIFCARQHAVSDDVSAIGDVVALIGAVIVVLDPWHAPVCLTRAWCLFELVHCELDQRRSATARAHVGMAARRHRIPLHLALAPSEQRELACAIRDNFALMETALGSLDSRNARASVFADKCMIFQAIEREFGGERKSVDAHDACDGAARAAVQRALAAFRLLTELTDRACSLERQAVGVDE